MRGTSHLCMRLFLTSALLSVSLVSAAGAQSVSVTAGNLHGSASAGSVNMSENGQKLASKNRPCNAQGMTVRSAGGNTSSSVSVSSSGGETAVAGAGSPDSTIERYDCRKTRTKHRR